jgi:hypothetical protein
MVINSWRAGNIKFLLQVGVSHLTARPARNSDGPKVEPVFGVKVTVIEVLALNSDQVLGTGGLPTSSATALAPPWISNGP